MELIGTIDYTRYEKKRKQGIIMTYTVKRIMEPDYGCEERPDDYIAMDKVILLDESSSEIKLEISDSELYEKDINEGDSVFLDHNNQIHKDA